MIIIDNNAYLSSYNERKNKIQFKVSLTVTFTSSMRVFQDFKLFVDKMLSITV